MHDRASMADHIHFLLVQYVPFPPTPWCTRLHRDGVKSQSLVEWAEQLGRPDMLSLLATLSFPSSETVPEVPNQIASSAAECIPSGSKGGELDADAPESQKENPRAMARAVWDGDQREDAMMFVQELRVSGTVEMQKTCSARLVLVHGRLGCRVSVANRSRIVLSWRLW